MSFSPWKGNGFKWQIPSWEGRGWKSTSHLFRFTFLPGGLCHHIQLSVNPRWLGIVHSLHFPFQHAATSSNTRCARLSESNPWRFSHGCYLLAGVTASVQHTTVKETKRKEGNCLVKIARTSAFFFAGAPRLPLVLQNPCYIIDKLLRELSFLFFLA